MIEQWQEKYIDIMLSMAFPGKINNKTKKIFLRHDYEHWSYRVPYRVSMYGVLYAEYEHIRLERWIETYKTKILSSYKLGYGEITNTVVIQEEQHEA